MREYYENLGFTVKNLGTCLSDDYADFEASLKNGRKACISATTCSNSTMLVTVNIF